MILSIYETEGKFDKIYENLCTQNCIRQILEHYGVKDYFKFFNTTFDIKFMKGTDGDNEIEFEVNESIMLDGYEKKLTRFKSKDADSLLIFQENKKTLEAGLPVVVDVNLYEMEYSETYQIYNNKHSVILSGVVNDNPVVIDNYVWKFKGEVPLEQYLKARSSECPLDDSPFSGVPILNSYCIVPPDGWKGDPAELLHATLHETLFRYYEETFPEKDQIYKGVNGLKLIIDLLESGKTLPPDKRLKNIIGVRRLVLFMKTSLSFHQQYVMKLSEMLNIKETKEYIDELSVSINLLDKFTYVIIKAMYREDIEIYNRILNYYIELMDAEEARYQVLKDLCKIL